MDKNSVVLNWDDEVVNPILVYYHIWNRIYCIINIQKYFKGCFDCEIGFKSNVLSRDNIFVIDLNKICKLLQEYIVNQLAQTNVFGNYFAGLSHYKTQKIQKEQIESLNKCKEYLDDNELLEYSISDLISTSGDIDDYKKLFSEDNNCHCVSNVIENRLCHGVFYHSTVYSLNLPNEMMFPKLTKFYKFSFIFSICLHCYPFHSHLMHQEYFLTECFNDKDNIFPNIAQMKEFNYLDYSYADGSADGTLLHGATDAVFVRMCQVLIKDDFACQKLNRRLTQGFGCFFLFICFFF